MSTWINSIIKPAETFKAEKAKASLGKGMFNYAIINVIAGFLVGIAIAVFVSILPSTGPYAQILSMLKVLGIAAIIVMPILFAILAIIGSLIGQGIFYIFAKLLKGQGTFVQQYYLTSLYVPILGIISFIVMLIPFIGTFISFIVALFTLYLLTIALRETHNYSTGRAVLTWLIAAIAIFIILLIIIVLAIMAFVIPMGIVGT